MADRTILLAQNKRHATRGLSVVNPQEFLAYQEDDDNLTYIVDMGAYLDGATIVLVTRTPTGVVISNASNTTTRLTQRLAGYGHVDFRVQTSAGDTEQFRVYIQPRAANPAFFLTAGSGGGITALDGDKGDVIVSSAGSTWTLDPTAVASLNVFTDTLKGVTPASGGGTTNFLRADGTWATPPGGGGGGGPVSDADYGDITVSSSGTVWTIDNNAVTLAKMADMATASVIYRKSAGTGDPEVQTLATLKTDLGLTGTNSGDQTITLTGNVTGSGTGSFATTIAAGAVGLSQMANMATSSLIYRKTAGSGAPEVNTLATLKTDLGLTGTNSGDQTITLTGDVTGSGTGSFTATIANDAVTYAKIQNVSATDRILGRSTSGAGDVEEITCTAAGRALIDDADATAQRTTLGLGAIALRPDIVNADVNASAAIAYSKLASMTGGSVLLGNASNVPTVTALTGDVTVSNAGVTAIGSGVIVNADVNASAAIDATKLSFLQAGTGAVARTVDSKLEDVFSVLDFGADPTGATASTTAIQAAIDAMTTGSTLYFPKGTYLINGSGLKFSGSSDNKTGLSFVGDNATLQLQSAVANANVAEIVSGSDYLVRGLTFKGNKGTVSPPGFANVQNITRTGTAPTVTVTVTTATNHGYSTSQQITLSGVSPSGYNGTRSITVTGATTFTFVMATDPGAYTSGGVAYGDFYYRWHNGLYIGAIATKTLSDVRIESCTFRDCHYAGLIVGSGPVEASNILPGVDGVTAANCVFLTNNSGVAGGAQRNITYIGSVFRSNDVYGVVIDKASTNISVAGNTFDTLDAASQTTIGVYVYEADYCTVQGNSILDGKVGVVASTGATYTAICGNTIQSASVNGILLQNTTHTTVTGNTVNDTGQAGIAVDTNTSQCTVSANVVSNAGFDNILVNGSRCTVSNNVCTAATGSGIKISGGSNVSVIGNVCLDNDKGNASTYAGIELSNTSGAQVIGNRCNDTRGSGSKTQNWGLLESGTSNNNFFAGNDFSGNKTADRSTVGTTNLYIGSPQTLPVVQTSDGSAAAPGFTFAGNSGSGLYRATNDTAVAANGSVSAVFRSVASAVDYAVLRSSSTGNVDYFAEGGTATINLNFLPKGSGGAVILRDNSNNARVIANGTGLGFFGATAIAQPSGANQAALTNSTGGTRDGTLADVGATYNQATLNNNFTDLHVLVNEIRTALVNLGLMKGSA